VYGGWDVSLIGKNVVLAGRFRLGRREVVAAHLERAGAVVQGALDNDTDLLIAGARPGDVEEEARNLRVAVWDERDLLAALARGDGISTLLEALREVLQERPSSAGWQHLVRVLDRWEDDGDLSVGMDYVGMDYAEDHLVAWSDELRLAPRHWLRSVLAGRHEPRLRLVRTITIRRNDLEEPSGIVRLAACAELAELTHLRASFCHITSEGAAAIAGSPWLSALRELDLVYNRIGPDGAVAIARSTTLTRLERLLLDGNPIGQEGLEALANAPALPLVATQTWRTQWARVQDAQHALMRHVEVLEDDASEVEAATSAARQLWMHARHEHDMTTFLPALEHASQRTDGHVAYFATLARIWHARRVGMIPMPALPIVSSGEPDITGVVRTSASTWYSSSRHARHGDPPMNLAGSIQRGQVCGVCGSLGLDLIYNDGFGSNAGGYDCQELVCRECGCFTLYEHEWG